MTKEEKQLLLQDLSARLPYGVICRGICNDFDVDKDEYIDKEVTGILTDLHSYKCCYGHVGLMNQCDIESIRPYLRPMESMTEEEMGEYAKFKLSNDNDVYEFTDFRTTGKGFINVHTSCKNGGNGYTFQINNRTMLYDGVIGIDWFNKKHFDYRGLIEKGLALKAPDGMYNFK